jgi:hypothetical protein
VVPHRGGVQYRNMIDEPLSLIVAGIWLMAAGMYPLGFLFGACSPCCQNEDQCPWGLQLDRCLRVATLGTSPPVGGDIRVSLGSVLSLGGMEGRGAGSFPTHPIQVYRVSSQVRVTVRLSLSAEGASRTPVGETRSQVWRFVRPSPVSPPSTVYDVLGPEWHLQVDVSVTGVATQEESGVSSSLGQDIHGQNRLILNVNQWTDAITHDEVVTLSPVGLQRWASFQLSQTSTSATLASGSAYTGWSVSRLATVTPLQQTVAVRLQAGTLSCGALPERIYLDDATATGFLNGDSSLSIGTCGLRMLADNILCGIAANRLEVGIALGIYPEFCELTPPEAFRASPIGTQSCVPAKIAMRALGECITAWRPTYRRRGVAILSPAASASSFYSGLTMLWNIEHGPYRNSFSTTGPDGSSGWVIELAGGGEHSVYDLTIVRACQGGLLQAFSDVCVPALSLIRSWEGECDVIDTASSTAAICALISSDNVSFTTKTVSFSGTSVDSLAANVFVQNGALTFRATPPSAQTLHAVTSGNHFAPVVLTSGTQCLLNAQHDQRWLRITVPAEQTVPISCDASGPLAVDFSNATAAETLNGQFPGTSGLPPEVFIWNGGFVARMGRLSPMQFSFSVSVTPTPEYSEQPRLLCSNWSVNNVPAGGAVITRTCDASGVSLSQTFGASRLRVPRLVAERDVSSTPTYVGTASITRAENCTMTNPLALYGSTASSTTQASPLEGDCIYLAPQFGSGFTGAGTGDAVLCGDQSFVRNLAQPRALPCAGCVVSVELLSGEQNATVRYVTQGDKAGLIEIIALRSWPVGQGVVFRISCGGDSVTHTVIRSV